MKRILKYILVLIGLLAVVYLIGPQPETPVYTSVLPEVPSDASALVQWVAAKERTQKVKPGNEATIVWANDSLRNQTEYVLLYLHGFSASHEEGSPVHRNTAKRFGCNLFLARLADHGVDTIAPMYEFTAERLWNSAVEAFAVAKKLGKKVIVIGTSTGGTLALQLAATYPEIAGMILLSPNVRISDPNSKLLNDPWGLHIAKWVIGKDYMLTKDQRPIYKKYWYSRYPLEPLPQLQELVETTMTPSTFAKIKQPTLLLYYYKDEAHQDKVVSVPAMLEMFEQLGTDAAFKQKKAMPNTGDHVIGSYIKSNDYQGVESEISLFLSNTLKLQIQQ